MIPLSITAWRAARRRNFRPAWSPIRPGEPPVSLDTLARQQSALDAIAQERAAIARAAQELVEAETPATCDYRFENPQHFCPFIRNHRGIHVPYMVSPTTGAAVPVGRSGPVWDISDDDAVSLASASDLRLGRRR